jgi:hypothetical protein
VALATQSFHDLVNVDLTWNSRYPNGDKAASQSSILAVNVTAFLAANITLQSNQGVAVSINYRTFLTGTSAATATITVNAINSALGSWTFDPLDNSLTNTGLVSGSGSLQVVATDNAGNTASFPVQLWSILAPIQQNAVKFHGGDFFWFDTLDASTGISRMQTAHSGGLKNNLNVTGYKIYAKLAQLIGPTAGDYSPAQAIIAQIRSVLSGTNKRWVLAIQDRTFGSTGAGGAFTGGTFPTYMINNGWALISNASTSVGGVANMFNFGSTPALTDYAALLAFLGTQLDSDPQFEMLDYMGETACTPAGPWHTGSSSGPSANFTNAQYRDAVNTLGKAASAAFPHTLVRLQTNFVPSSDTTTFTSWYTTLLPLGNVTFGGPDPPLITATGYSADAKYWQGQTAPGTDLRGVRARSGEVQEDGLGTPRIAGGTGTTAAAAVGIIAQGLVGNLKTDHMFWNYETWETVVANDIINYINQNPTRNGVPSLGNWNTA